MSVASIKKVQNATLAIAGVSAVAPLSGDATLSLFAYVTSGSTSVATIEATPDGGTTWFTVDTLTLTTTPQIKTVTVKATHARIKISVLDAAGLKAWFAN